MIESKWFKEQLRKKRGIQSSQETEFLSAGCFYSTKKHEKFTTKTQRMVRVV